MAKNCIIKRNVNKQVCGVEYSQILNIWLTEDNSGLPYSDFLTESNITAKLNAATSSRWYPIFPLSPDDATANNEEELINTGNTRKRTKVRDGKVDMTFEIRDISYEHATHLKSFDKSNMYAYMITKSRYIVGADNGTNLYLFQRPASNGSKPASFHLLIFKGEIPALYQGSASTGEILVFSIHNFAHFIEIL